MKFTEIRNSTENLEFHDFHEIHHKNDDFLLDFIRVSRYGWIAWFSFAIGVLKLAFRCGEHGNCEISVPRGAKSQKSRFRDSRNLAYAHGFLVVTPPVARRDAPRAENVTFSWKSWFFRKKPRKSWEFAKIATSWRPCQKHKLNKWFNIGFEGAVHAKSRFSGGKVILHENHDWNIKK